MSHFDNIKGYGDYNAPIVVAGTKSDLPDKVIEPQRLEKLASSE
jgi:hypothetical protein